MQDGFYRGLDFSTTGEKISIINFKKEIKDSNSAPNEDNFKNPNFFLI